MLGAKIPVFIGLISYSAYLWHQPLFAFAKHLSLKEPTTNTFLLLSLLSLGLAYLTWRFIEAPFRNKAKFSRAKIFSYTVVCSLAFIGIGGAGYLTKGFEFRLDNNIAEAINLATAKTSKEELCIDKNQNKGKESLYCVLNPKPKNNIFLYGDSHTKILMAEAKKMFLNTDYGLLASSKPGCVPLYGFGRLDLNNNCYQHNINVHDYLLATPEIEYVVLSARWTLSVEGSRFNNEEGGKEPGTQPISSFNSGELLISVDDIEYEAALVDAFKATITSLLDANKKVILIYPVPEAGWSVPEQIIKYAFNHPELAFDESVASTSYDVFKARNKKTYAILDNIPKHNDLYVIKPDSLLCNTMKPGRCVTQSNGTILYSDDNHLSDAGAKLILNKVFGLLSK